jgi:23S rRNA G2069 N7-methylase RlmK/C1962 C5-methylase RlmI
LPRGRYLSEIFEVLKEEKQLKREFLVPSFDPPIFFKEKRREE